MDAVDVEMAFAIAESLTPEQTDWLASADNAGLLGRLTHYGYTQRRAGLSAGYESGLRDGWADANEERPSDTAPAGDEPKRIGRPTNVERRRRKLAAGLKMPDKPATESTEMLAIMEAVAAATPTDLSIDHLAESIAATFPKSVGVADKVLMAIDWLAEV